MANAVDSNQSHGSTWIATCFLDDTGTPTLTVLGSGTRARLISAKGSLIGGTNSPVVDWSLEDASGSELFRAATGAGAPPGGEKFKNVKTSGLVLRVNDLLGTSPSASVTIQYEYLGGTRPTVV